MRNSWNTKVLVATVVVVATAILMGTFGIVLMDRILGAETGMHRVAISLLADEGRGIEASGKAAAEAARIHEQSASLAALSRWIMMGLIGVGVAAFLFVMIITIVPMPGSQRPEASDALDQKFERY
jgi:hypothetical protein